MPDPDFQFERALDIYQIPVGVDLWANKLRTWEFIDRYTGWSPQYSPRRRGREMRLRHVCEQPAKENKNV